MTPESILARNALILSQQAREAYFEQGFIVASGFLGQGWLQRMREAYLAAVERSRPYLIHGMSAADAISYTAMTWGNSHSGEIICGKPARYAHHEDMVMPLPPDWTDGYTPIFEHHRREKNTQD